MKISRTTQWFDYVDDNDLQTTESYHGMIMVCEDCGALFGQKACGNRTIFPWFGYHPTDGNCKIISEQFSRIVEEYAHSCPPEHRSLRRITAKKDLFSAILDHPITK